MHPIRIFSRHNTRLECEELEDRCVPSTTAYVDALYTKVLDRGATQQEVAGWVAFLNSGGSPGAVVAAFTQSTEYFDNLVRSYYVLFLNRAGAPEEVAGWVAQLQAGLTETELEASFASSAEFFALHGGDTLNWLGDVYQKVLGRTGSSNELSYWNEVLGLGASRYTVSLQIVISPEADSRLIATDYLQFLARPVDAAGLNYWVGQLEQGLTPDRLVDALASSAEFIALQGGLD